MRTTPADIEAAHKLAGLAKAPKPGLNRAEDCKILFPNRPTGRYLALIFCKRNGLSPAAAGLLYSHYATQQNWGVYWFNWQADGVTAKSIAAGVAYHEAGKGGTHRVRCYGSWDLALRAFLDRLGPDTEGWLSSLSGTAISSGFVVEFFGRIRASNFFGDKVDQAGWIEKRLSDMKYHARKFCESTGGEWQP